jgi:hypothetical protein
MRYTYTSTKYDREPDNKGLISSHSSTRPANKVKRMGMLLLMTVCLVFAGAQSAPSAQKGGSCDLVCSAPFIDPNDGQCKVMCCPQDDKCARRCELRPCKGAE